MLKNKFKYNFLIYSIIYTVIFIFLKIILNALNIEFMDWFYYLSFNFIYITAVVGIIQLILKIKKRILKNIFLVIIIILVIFISLIYIIFQTLMYKNNHIIQKNNQKMEVAVSYWDRLFTIDYYDYINPIMRSKDYIDSEINIIYKFVTPDNKSIYKTYDPFKSVPEYQKYTKKSLTHDLLEYYINFLEYIMDITYFKIM